MESSSSILHSDSEDSMLHITSLAPTHSTLLADTILDVPKHRSRYDLSGFVMGIAIWAETMGITRLDYVSLREVLKPSEMKQFGDLTKSLSNSKPVFSRRVSK